MPGPAYNVDAEGRPVYPKDPRDEQPYGIDFANLLEGAAIDEVQTDVVVPTDPGAVVKGDLVFTATVAACWLSGGTDGQVDACRVDLVTTDVPARHISRSFLMDVRNR